MIHETRAVSTCVTLIPSRIGWVVLIALEKLKNMTLTSSLGENKFPGSVCLNHSILQPYVQSVSKQSVGCLGMCLYVS